MLRSFLIAAALLAATSCAAFSQAQEGPATPVLRASVTVSSDIVRIGDVVENAGTAAQIAIFRAPDLGTTGSLPTAKLLSALRAHDVIGVDTFGESAPYGALMKHFGLTIEAVVARAEALLRG